MKYSEACPKCNSEDYTVEDYQDSFEQFDCSQWWDCSCPKCGQKFTIYKRYKLVEVQVEPAEVD